MASQVETKFLEQRDASLSYRPDEKIGVLVADNFPRLGTLTAARFLEWVQANPEGVVSLPTGKTPEFFIKETRRLLDSWEDSETRHELESLGLDPSVRPRTEGLRFVQIDEFYPINPRHQNSFYYYVQKYYVDGFGLDPERGLFIRADEIGVPAGETLESVWGEEGVDLSLRYRLPASRREEMQQRVLREVDQWCVEYEDQVRRFGGIGFFLGGIGPDGHIGFNVRGSDMHSTTRLTEINYETKAAAAGDLGGIEVADKRLVITVGLETITANPQAVALIMAAGEAKARVVADAVQSERHVNYPATALQTLKHARFFLTEGAAKHLTARRVAELKAREELSPQEIERVVFDVSIAARKRLVDLTSDDFKAHPEGKVLLVRAGRPAEELGTAVREQLRTKIEAGMDLPTSTVFLHTEPHHDDIMLGYMPYVVRTIRDHSNTHHFATLTSGFTSVTNVYMLDLCRQMAYALEYDPYDFKRLFSEGYFDPDNAQFEDYDVLRYLDGIASRDDELKREGTLRRLLRNLIRVFEEIDPAEIRDRVDELINYFQTQYPGKKDLPHIQKLKGMVREWESACLWGYFGWDSESVEDLRLGFYKGEIFTEEPEHRRDVLPVLELLRRLNPDIVTVAFDPEASGPDTHYKVLQAVSEALRLWEQESGRSDIRILGYRNVWYRFHASEATHFVPVSLNMLTLQHYSFMNTYISQREASFPSYEHKGPFSELSQRIQVEQYDRLTVALGRDWFYEHESALIRATRGFAFVRLMTLEEFYGFSRDLRRRAENA
ncbi:MAG: glucosamine-6-phosphate deaminase [Spirochaetota bacterium]